MKTQFLFISIVSCLLLSLAISCENSYDKINISNSEIGQVKSSMRVIKSILQKSSFDTIAIKKYKIQCEIDNDILYSTKKNINLDSIRKSVSQNFDFKIWFPLKKELYQTKEGEIILNGRLIGKNINDFKRNIFECSELKNFKREHKEKFINSFMFLIKNNIWSCRESYYDNKKEYYFDYSKDNLYYSESSSRYLYLQEDIKENINLINNYLFLDEKKGIFLYTKK